MRQFVYKNTPTLVFIYHVFLAFLGALVYVFPSRKLYIVGITGTKGKSTTIELIAVILEAAGKKVTVSSSLRNGDSSMTMPGRFFLQRFLRQAVNSNANYALIEVTSQGIIQNRHKFIKWDAAIFTNLAPEHIEAHGSFEQYRKAKLAFFKYVSHKPFFINRDDPNARYFTETANSDKVVLYGKSDLPTKLVGDFNKYNIGAAVAFARSQNINDDIIKKAIADFSGVAGRMEYVYRGEFSVVVDYAHTPDSLQKVYKTLSQISGLRKTTSLTKTKRLICVLGSAGGGRDKWKRPEMGKIAAEYCDEIILTNEDPYDEQPEKIIEEIFSGCSQIRNPKSEILKIIDRKEAIKKALSLAKTGDMIVLTGKGSEKWIHLERGRKITWSEKEITLDILKSII